MKKETIKSKISLYLLDKELDKDIKKENTNFFRKNYIGELFKCVFDKLSVQNNEVAKIKVKMEKIEEELERLKNDK